MKIIYVFDPLCGWCYGFEGVMEKVQKEYKDQFDFDVLAGGMVLGQNVQPISKMRSFLEGAIPRLEQTTGVKISQAYRNNILASPTVALSSEMPSMVFNYLKNSQKGKEVELARKIQDLLYDKGLNTNDIDTYDSLIRDYGMDLSIKKEITSEENRQATYSMFQQSKAMGVSGYPALLVEVDDQLYSLSSGYLPEQNLKAKLDQVLQMFAE